MKILHKIIAVLNLLFLASFVFLLLNLSLIIAMVHSSLGVALLVLLILVPFFWGIINAVGYLGGNPVPLNQLSAIEKFLALIPLLNLIIAASIVFILFMLN